MNMYREMLGLGQPTGIELDENIGVLDSPSYRASIGQTWQTGFSLQSAIGQAGNLFTPLQLCNYVSTIANGGTRYAAHIIKAVYSSDNSTIIEEKQPEVLCETGFKKKNIQIIKEGMRRVATVTLAGSFDDSVVEVACKTGTSTLEKQLTVKPASTQTVFLLRWHRMMILKFVSLLPLRVHIPAEALLPLHLLFTIIIIKTGSQRAKMTTFRTIKVNKTNTAIFLDKSNRK